MYALALEDAPEDRARSTVVVDDEKGEKELKNKQGKVSTVNTDHCIGCGVCVYKCPSKSLVLERKEVLDHSPKDLVEYAQLALPQLAATRKQGKQG